ncbi:NAD-dependent epimerase/dehydratase family protein [Actinokineospora sp. PR83]|uniref:NAD-dependent epimerase/dehydratase family protein n=1 Tax=Actinokineospora sp. PR83 TaxID=2884908 RepID=UPI001F340E4C|nr:NAD-dependent epimerase/dehydratase family protein [Actinokineospora sp. PR83]MCG8917250.1 NAD-dependent epimerase/dehydratase family protein [Actinokineospora sp. PR83]
MRRAGEIERVLAELRSAAPPRGVPVDPGTRERLRGLSADLVRLHRHGAEEYLRFLAAAERDIVVPVGRVQDLIEHRRVLVTGASGQVGAALCAALLDLGPRVLSTVAASPTAPAGPVEHHAVDVRDRAAVAAVFGAARPDIVFHLAGHSDYGLGPDPGPDPATTTILGTRHVVEAAIGSRAGALVLGSTERSLMPYSRDSVTAAERIAELIVADASTRGLLRTAVARAAHVVDPVPLVERLRRAGEEDSVVWLPDTGHRFHIQSARECVRLLLATALGAGEEASGLHAVRDLAHPVRAFDLVLGALAEEGLAAVPLADDSDGHDGCPDLAAPMGASGTSALFNAFEAPLAVPSSSPAVDLVPVRFRLPTVAGRLMDRIDRHSAAGEPGAVQETVDRLAKTLLEGMLAQAPPPIVRLVARLSSTMRSTMSPTDRMVDDRVRWWAER